MAEFDIELFEMRGAPDGPSMVSEKLLRTVHYAVNDQAGRRI
jgi:hypothetical protein